MSKEKKTNKANKADEMFKYTSRDLGQEYIMKKRMVAAIFALIIALAALAVFIALYIDALRRVQETYRTQYRKCIELVIYENFAGFFLP